jgi:hypothetical protein
LAAPGLLFAAPTAEGGRFGETCVGRLAIGVLFDGVELFPAGVVRFAALLPGRFCESCWFWRFTPAVLFCGVGALPA